MAFMCQVNMAAHLPIYRTMGATGVTHERASCVADGAQECLCIVRWDG